MLRALEKAVDANRPEDWALALVILMATIATLAVLKHVVAGRLAAYARRTETVVDDLIGSTLAATRLLLLFPLAVYFASHALALTDKADRILAHFAVVGLLQQAALWGNRFTTGWIRHSLDSKAASDPAGASTLGVLGVVARIALWAFVVLLALDNLGFNITTLLAGLGIGGVAVALAAQNILGDLFASVSIVLDKPFVIGDFIVVGEQMGTVEHIGLKTTRVRSLSGEQVVFTNTDLLRSRIRNYRRMQERRVQFGFGVLYGTTAAELEAIPTLVRAAIEAQPGTRFDRAHFTGYGDSALTYEAVYYVLDADYNVYMDIHQAVLLALLRQLRERNIGIAFPTRTVHVEHDTTGANVPHATGNRGGSA